MNAVRNHPLAAAVLPAFRLVANVEALSWAGLLVGMLFKYVLAGQAELGESLVAVFGRIHGGLVVAYVALAALLGVLRRWHVRILGLAIAATIPPFATLAFDAWAHRTGRYQGRPAGAPANRP